MKAILIVGPSGAGKDTLLRAAKHHFAQVETLGFVKRYVTRPPDNNEDNFYLDTAAFSILEQSSFFISSWHAHGNYYGIPRHQLLSENDKKTSIASISRSAVTDFERDGIKPVTITITASSDVLEQRLVARGREGLEKVQKRMQRSSQIQCIARNNIVFDNSAKLDHSKKKFIALLEDIHFNQ